MMATRLVQHQGKAVIRVATCVSPSIDRMASVGERGMTRRWQATSFALASTQATFDDGKWRTRPLLLAAAAAVTAGGVILCNTTDCEHGDRARVQRTFTKSGVRDPMTSYARYALEREEKYRREHPEEQDSDRRDIDGDDNDDDDDPGVCDPHSTYAIYAERREREREIRYRTEHPEEYYDEMEEALHQRLPAAAALTAPNAALTGNAVPASLQATSSVNVSPGKASVGAEIASHSSRNNEATTTTPPQTDNVSPATADMTPAEVRLEEATRKAKQHAGGLKVFSGNGNMSLALEIARHLGISLGKATVGRFADGEVNVQVNENVRGKDVYVVQPTGPPVNDNIMELLLMVSTLRRASARRITVVIPYYGYARQDRKMQARVPISAADVARLMEAMGIDRVIAVDLHCGQIQGFFGPRVPVDNLDGGIVGLDYFGCKDLHNPVIVSPDAGGVYRAKKFKEGLEQKYEMTDLGLAMIVKQRARAGSVDQMDLVGDVKDCDCIIVDDMIDTAGTLCKAADVLTENGARRVFAFASHGLLSGPGNDRIANSRLVECVVLNTIPTTPQREANEKLTELSVAPLLAQAIFNIHAKKSVSALFK